MLAAECHVEVVVAFLPKGPRLGKAQTIGIAVEDVAKKVGLRRDKAKVLFVAKTPAFG